jgi:hypothetical protein
MVCLDNIIWIFCIYNEWKVCAVAIVVLGFWVYLLACYTLA